MNTTTNIRFNRWTKGSIDRFYVNGTLGGINNPVYLEKLGDSFHVVIKGTTDTTLKCAIYRDIDEALKAIFGDHPTWQQMIDACS